MLEITFLGTGSGPPTKVRNHSSLYFHYNQDNMLFDCGEGTQRQMIIAKGLSFMKIDHIFITHWHADHCYKHHPIAIQAFLLLTFIAYNIFHIFVCRNLKPALRDTHTTVHFARQVTAELYCRHAARPP